jgi:hypothetical protein
MNRTESSDYRARRLELEKRRDKQNLEAKKLNKVKIALGVTLVCMILASVFFLEKSKGPTSKTPQEIAATVKAPKHLNIDGSFKIDGSGSVITSPKDVYDPERVRVQVFFDPMCTNCAMFDRSGMKFLLRLENGGLIDLYLSPTSFLDDRSTDKYSTRAVNAIATVATEAPESFYKVVSALYLSANLPETGNKYQPISDEELISHLKSVGVNEKVAIMTKDQTYMDWVAKQSTYNISRTDLFNNDFGAPAVIVGGKMGSDGRVTEGRRVIFTVNEPAEVTLTKVIQETKEDQQ